LFLLCLFFFQAEDGIRDFHVTGVQTCLFRSSLLAPISRTLFAGFASVQHDVLRLRRAYATSQALCAALLIPVGVGVALVAEPLRSEERRVGTECSGRWWRALAEWIGGG